MKFDTRSIDIDNLTIANLLDLYETCYWCYAQDRHRTEPHKLEDIKSYEVTLKALYHVIEYMDGEYSADRETTRIRDRINAKRLIAERMSARCQSF